MVECSGLKPSRSGAGRIYFLMDGRTGVSETFAPGQRIGRYEVLLVVSLPGFGMGMTLFISSTTPSSISLFQIPKALSCRTLNVMSSLIYSIVGACVVVVCHDQVRLQVSQGFRCRDS